MSGFERPIISKQSFISPSHRCKFQPVKPISRQALRDFSMKFIFGVCLCAAFATPALAQIEEIRAGIGAHDISVIGTVPVKEQALVVNAEIVFDEPKFLKWALSPQPYINGSLNLGGSTSYAGAGLLWRQNISKRFYADFGFGLVVHDGTLDIFDDIDASGLIMQGGFDTFFSELGFLRENRLEYGSRVLLREQLTVGYRLDEDWAVEGYFEHVSHGNLWTDAENDGSDSAGFRVNRKF